METNTHSINPAVADLKAVLKSELKNKYSNKEVTDKTVDMFIQRIIGEFIHHHVGQWEKIKGDWNKASDIEKKQLLCQCIKHFKSTQKIDISKGAPDFADTMTPDKTVKAQFRQEELDAEIIIFEVDIKNLLEQINPNASQYFIRNQWHQIETELNTIGDYSQKIEFLNDKKQELEKELRKGESEEVEVRMHVIEEPQALADIQEKDRTTQKKEIQSPTIKKIKDTLKKYI